MVGKSTHLQVIPQPSTRNTANLPLQCNGKFADYRHMRQTSELFLLFNTGVGFSLHNNFANSGSFAKVPVPVHIYNSLALSRNYRLTLIQSIIPWFFKGIMLVYKHTLRCAATDTTCSSTIGPHPSRVSITVAIFFPLLTLKAVGKMIFTSYNDKFISMLNTDCIYLAIVSKCIKKHRNLFSF